MLRAFRHAFSAALSDAIEPRRYVVTERRRLLPPANTVPNRIGTMHEIPRELSRHVMVNDREYGSLGRGTNAVAFFLLDRSSVRRTGDDTVSFRAIAMMYWNIEDEDFVFSEPGRYRVRFHPEARVEVVVEQPTKDEEEIIARMRDLGLGFAKFIMGPDDNRAGALSPDVEQMLEEYPDTAYPRHLSM